MIKFVLNLIRFEELFEGIVSMIFKYEETTSYFKPGISYLSKNIANEQHLKCSLIVLDKINKVCFA